MSKVENKSSLYDWYLHFNPYTGYWNAVKRDKSINYLNGELNNNDVIRHKNINDLIKYITQLK